MIVDLAMIDDGRVILFSYRRPMPLRRAMVLAFHGLFRINNNQFVPTIEQWSAEETILPDDWVDVTLRLVDEPVISQVME